MNDMTKTQIEQLDQDNPLGVDGFEFVEFTGPEPRAMIARLETMGFTQTHLNPRTDVVRPETGRHQLPGASFACGPRRRLRPRPWSVGQRHGLPHHRRQGRL